MRSETIIFFIVDFIIYRTIKDIKKEKEKMKIEDKLKKLIEEQKEKSFTDPSRASDCDALGIMISQYLKWDGNEIFKTCYNAFEDANYHSLNEKFEELFKKMNHELSYKFDVEIKLIEKEVKKRA